MEKEELKKLLNKQSEEIKRHIGVLSEDFDAKIQLVAEQYGSIMEVLEKSTRDIEAIKENIITTNIRLSHIEDQLRRKVDYEDFERLEKRLSVLEARAKR